MTYLLCRNRVAGFAEWRAIFASHQATHLNAGLRLLWLAREGTDNAFFMFEVADMARARMFISDPDANRRRSPASSTANITSSKMPADTAQSPLEPATHLAAEALATDEY